jgi:hypothetical protein
MTEETPKVFSLRLAGDGINIEQQIEQHVALQVVQVVMGGGAPAVAPTNAGVQADARFRTGAPLSLREYLDNIGASRKPDQIATIANYVCEIEGQADFSRDDIRSRFITAREPLPANFARDFAVALKHGWIAEVHGKKDLFYVTARGVQAINNKFVNEKATGTRR